jgi:hypothetical protein
MFAEYEGDHPPPVTQGALDALAASDLILSEPYYERGREQSRKCTLMGNAFAAVDSDFDAPDTSFVTQLTRWPTLPTWIMNSRKGVYHL